MRVVQTVDLPEAVPPATPIMKGVRRAARDDFLEPLQFRQLWSFVIAAQQRSEFPATKKFEQCIYKLTGV